MGSTMFSRSAAQAACETGPRDDRDDVSWGESEAKLALSKGKVGPDDLERALIDCFGEMALNSFADVPHRAAHFAWGYVSAARNAR